MITGELKSRTIASGTRSQARLFRLPIEVPPMGVQRLFASHIDSFGAERKKVERALASDNALFASLQARAFSGEL